MADELKDAVRGEGEPVGMRLAHAVRDYAAAVRMAVDHGEAPPQVLVPEAGVTPTDVMIAVDALLRGAEIAIFEIQLWRSLGRITAAGDPLGRQGGDPL